MSRPLVVLLLFALPAVAAPVPKGVKKPFVPAVAGTHWHGSKGDDTTCDYTFHPDGTFSAEQNGRLYSKGTWKQDGEALEWEFNNRYSVYTVTLKDGTYTGTATNVKGKSWAVTLTPLAK
jgi:hypothetical protein